METKLDRETACQSIKDWHFSHVSSGLSIDLLQITALSFRRWSFQRVSIASHGKDATSAKVEKLHNMLAASVKHLTNHHDFF